jgi:hypothetical protein
MQVIATAGHVDHGKSALVRALTGMESDRWAEERRRGMTIDLGFAWMDLPGGERLAFVDVPGHERFVPNMLAGVGPVPAVLLVVAADGGWMPQSAEHLAAIDAVGIRHGLLAVTRCDLADPGPATRKPQPALPAHVLAGVRAVLADLAREPFMAPEAGRLRELGLDPRAIAAAARAGLLLRVTEQIVLAPDAETRATRLLAKLPQPFTATQARQVLGTTRRVAIPLLEHLDRAGVTQRLPDDRRRLRLAAASPAKSEYRLLRWPPAPVAYNLGEGPRLMRTMSTGSAENQAVLIQRLRNSGERRRASATRRAVPMVLAMRRKRNPPPWTRNTDAPGGEAIETVA